MLEKLRDLQFVLSLLTGKGDKKTLEKKLLAQTGKSRRDELSKDEQKEFEELVEGMQSLNDIFDEVVTFQATLNKKYYDALIKTGFKPAEAIQIVAHSRGISSGNISE
jgi:hypothetical protein